MNQIGEIKESSKEISISSSDHELLLHINRSTIELTDDQYELLKEIYHISEPRKAYSRAVYRKKLLEAFSVFERTPLDVRTTITKQNRMNPPALFHFKWFDMTRERAGDSIKFIHTLIKKNMVAYVKPIILDKLVSVQTIDDFNSTFADLIKKRYKEVNSNKTDIDVITDFINTKNRPYNSFMVGVNSINVIKIMQLYNIDNPKSIEASYTQYKENNYLIHHLNNEFTGIY